MDELIDHHAVAQYLGITTRTLRTWIGSGKIPAPISIGRRRLWVTSILDAWLKVRAEHGITDPHRPNISHPAPPRRGRPRLPA